MRCSLLQADTAGPKCITVVNGDIDILQGNVAFQGVTGSLVITLLQMCCCVTKKISKIGQHFMKAHFFEHPRSPPAYSKLLFKFRVD